MDILNQLKQVTDAPAPKPKQKIETISRNDQERARYQQGIQWTAENIARSSGLRAAINKGVNSGMDERELLLLALECIATMTGDKVFQLNIKKIQERG